MRNRRILKTIVAVGTAFSLVFLSGSFATSYTISCGTAYYSDSTAADY